MAYFIILIYSFFLLLIFLFSLGQLHLSSHYLRRLKHKKDQPESKGFLPAVTVQLPVYNELYVIERLIQAVAEFDYPQDRLEIQVLDDSTDETVHIIAQKVVELKAQGLAISHIRRPKRKDFKAGALQYGMEKAKGEFIAIFDADFVPPKDFLRKTLPYFQNEKTGVVQTRWGHLNKDYSLLTKLQAFGLDAHFSVEQGGRKAAGSFINFNGTAGVWRKSCIIDAGEWSADTLTEDLDLSYRAQLKGWEFEYLEEVVTPAELPVLMPAIKSQQYRWNKGAAETAKKNLGKVIRSKIGFFNKVHATFHLLNSSVFVSLLFAALFSIPVLFIKAAHPELNLLFHLGGIFLIGFFSIAYFYWISTKRIYPEKSFQYYIKTLPPFLIISMGLSLHNAVAVLEGLLGRKTPFIRTPKFNIQNKKDSWKENIYLKGGLHPLTLLEGLLCLYFLFGVMAGIYLNDWGLIIFHAMLSTGFGSIFYHSLRSAFQLKRG
ncbi:cellulose synthase family protein [Xanthovirga aplysinae]|uniref:cellulose synthase family protein n=1 Tax=Xanthovirga aplysinae TaxID=2529853 RepID=UPI0012BC5714|nr:cellulose synthase family protein [Xanthovirga aplysinae]MTI32050.1 glycosyltransferase [Xanthovirga aplysinae]